MAHLLDEIVGVSVDDGLIVELTEKEFGLLAEYIVDIDAHQYLNLLNLGELLAKLEIARAAEISHYSLEGMEIEHIVGDSLEFLKKGIIRCIIKELCAHTVGISLGNWHFRLPLSRNDC